VDENIPFGFEAFSTLGEVELCAGRKIDNNILQNADALVVRSITKVNEELLKNTNVKFVGTATIGKDHIDEEYLSKNGIAFSSAAGCNSYSVTEYVFSALAFLANKYNGGNGYESTDEMHLFVAGGYVFDLNKDFKLKPHFLLFNNINQSIQADLNLNMLYMDTFELGLSYRLQDAVSAMFNVRLFQSLRLGYAYDVHLSDVSYYSPVSHEFFLNYDWALGKKVMLSPRYF